RHDVVAAMEQPGERELRRQTPLLLRERLDMPHEIEVLLEVLSLEPWHVATPVVACQVLVPFDLTRQEPSSERAVRDKADTELANRRQDLILGVAAPQRIFRLERRNGLHTMRAPDRCRCGLG